MQCLLKCTSDIINAVISLMRIQSFIESFNVNFGGNYPVQFISEPIGGEMREMKAWQDQGTNGEN